MAAALRMPAPKPDVLVVEDDEAIRTLLAQALRGEGYPVAVAANGLEALHWLQNHPRPGLIVLDLAMPVMDGWQFLGAVREKPGCRHIPVLVVSAFLEREPMTNVSAIPKPIDLGLFLRMVGGLVD